jgi:hypothetical protein
MKEKGLTFREEISKIKKHVYAKDVLEICVRAGYNSTATFYQACKKNDWSELTFAQTKVIEEAIKMMEEHKKKHEELREKLAVL